MLAVKIITYSLIILTFLLELWLSLLNYKNRNAEIPKEVSDIYNQDDYKKWHKYYLTNFKFQLVVKALNLIIFVILLASGFFPLIDKLSTNITTKYELQMLIFISIYFLINYFVDIFTSYYQTFFIEENFGFNKTTKSTFFKDKVKNLFLTIIIGGGLVYGLAAMYHNVNTNFYLYAYLSVVIGFLLINIFYVKLIVPIFNKLKPLEESELKTKIETFARSVGYEIKKISIIDASKRSTKLNAYFSGFGRFKQVVLYDTLVDKCSDDEIVSVLAHEIGHSKRHHIIYNILITFILLSIYIGVLVVFLKFSIFSKAFNFNDIHFGFALILFIIYMNPVSFIINILTSYISRKFEYQADAFSALNYEKESMKSALKILAKENFSNLTPHPLYVTLTYSHPTITQRIKAINKL